MSVRRAFTVSLTALWLAYSPSLFADATKQEQQLQQLTEQIQRQQTALSQGQVNKNKQLKALRNSEKAVSNSTKALRQSASKVAAADAQLSKLKAKQTELEQQRQAQQQQLAVQIRSAWMSGNNDGTAILLGNDDPAQLERMMVYYQYLNDARIDAIEVVKSTEIELAEVAQEQQLVRDKQAALHEQRQRQQQQLKKDLAQREAVLKDLQKQLNQQQQQLVNMQENRDVLAAAIEQALQLLAQSQSYNGLSNNGSLPWPIRAKLSKRFGSHRQGQLKWNGWLLTTSSGKEVKAISSGQVIFADWLRGFGLVVVVDHGEEYLSLYGHAQALLKQVGDPVSGGEVLALSGNSGGLDQPGLYFEIRHRGRAIDPKPFLKKG
ncbi:murein hydrolase activator EnvC family protein [Ferrimonas lipolytica]|uniref:Peptidoglycan DD-metalloendopeptidase family protein n=1 Tax=Ferrimonas lipolytica TaxID=2724191 RepID=A0A6H1UKD1_9GAMM|nr:peptidoglycan DD-metalloendopeptidase family protein [Ferrimonas lipolytica]QIZ78262.1 peptidoglycan DD-metalloendopeptidase family protein [Ferrimonas lipolytica]